LGRATIDATYTCGPKYPSSLHSASEKRTRPSDDCDASAIGTPASRRRSITGRTPATSYISRCIAWAVSIAQS
jgi:hypothetical protein